MKPGDIVRMNAACKRALFKTHSHDHVREFGRCYGVIIGPTDWGNQQGPEWDVRWQPSDLRYSYAEEHLVIAPLKAWYVELPGDYPDEAHSTIVYAYTKPHARELGCCDMSTDYECVVAWRVPKYDVRATEVGVETDARFLRLEGWATENEYRCEQCGLAAFGLEEYGVCRECLQCKECGCEPECHRSEGYSCE